MILVGLPDTALREARDRIRSAIVNRNQQWPQRRITVGLSPASLPKRGSGFDVGLAIAIMSADGRLCAGELAGTVFLGELGLDGRLRPVPGVLPCIAAAAAAGFSRAVVPPQNAAEATVVPGVQVGAAADLGALVGWLKLTEIAGPDGAAGDVAGVRIVEAGAPLAAAGAGQPAPGQSRDLADVVGQPVAPRAAEVCAPGG